MHTTPSILLLLRLMAPGLGDGALAWATAADEVMLVTGAAASVTAGPLSGEWWGDARSRAWRQLDAGLGDALRLPVRAAGRPLTHALSSPPSVVLAVISHVACVPVLLYLHRALKE
jgi:hypothetical protein